MGNLFSKHFTIYFPNILQSVATAFILGRGECKPQQRMWWCFYYCYYSLSHIFEGQRKNLPKKKNKESVPKMKNTVKCRRANEAEQTICTDERRPRGASDPDLENRSLALTSGLQSQTWPRCSSLPREWQLGGRLMGIWELVLCSCWGSKVSFRTKSLAESTHRGGCPWKC